METVHVLIYTLLIARNIENLLLLLWRCIWLVIGIYVTASLLYADSHDHLFKETVVTGTVAAGIVTSNLSVYLKCVSLWLSLILYQMFGWNFILEQWQNRCWNRFPSPQPTLYLFNRSWFVCYVFPHNRFVPFIGYLFKTSYYNLGCPGFFSDVFLYSSSFPWVPSFYKNTECVENILATNLGKTLRVYVLWLNNFLKRSLGIRLAVIF